MCCVIPTLLEHLAANSGINEIWFAKAAFYLWQWSMLWWGMNRKVWTTFCVILSVSRCGKNFLYKRNQSTSYIRTWPFSHKPKLSTSVFPALSVILLESWIWSLLKRSIKAFRAIAEWLEHRIKKITQKVKVAPKPKCIAYHIKTLKVQQTWHDIPFRDLTIFNPREGWWCPKKIVISSNYSK